MNDYYDYYNSTYIEDREDSGVHRLLATDGEAPTVDYAVISVVILTLGLILAIEVFRHQLDVAASGNPFFQTVLELMYRELTTLGIVEFCIYLMHKYQEGFNYQLEGIFVDVHFMLFYTAVFNAIQSCLVRLLAGRRTDKIWIQTEEMDIRHYIGIRKEFDHLESMLKRVNADHGWQNNAPSHSLGNSNTSAIDSQSSSVWKSFLESMHDLAFKIRHPRLSRKKNNLLIPIRFHELRAHFIDSNNLPPKFKVSHYLKRSLTSVLLDFVHISSAAWIGLMATANLLYFLSGMILNVTKDSLEVEEFLMYIFLLMMVLFVAFAFILYFKMKSIFSKILHMKLTVYDPTQDDRKTWRGFSALNSRNTKTVDQVNLFWGNNPHFIIVATQYMQFGYALGLALTFTYYKDFAKYYNIINPNYLFLALLASYLIFLSLVSVIIPWYTLCTSMGQLVNKERLHETLAKLKLSEEIRRKESLEEERKAEEEIARRKREIEAKNAELAATASGLPNMKLKDAPDPQQRRGSGLRLLSVVRNKSSDPLDGGPVRSSELRTPDQGNRNVDALGIGSGRSWLRHARKKSISDGVQFMMSNRSLNASNSNSPPDLPTCHLSAAAAHQLHSADEDELRLGPLLQTKSTFDRLDRPVHLRQDKRQLKKSISDNVAFMRALKSTDHDSLESLSWQNEKPSQLPNDINSDKQHVIGHSLSKSRTDEESRIECRSRLRSNSKESPTTRSIEQRPDKPLPKESGAEMPQNIVQPSIAFCGASLTGPSPRLSENSAELTMTLSIDKNHSDPFTAENHSLQPEIALSVPEEAGAGEQHYNIQSLITSDMGEESGIGCSPRLRANSADLPVMLSIDESHSDPSTVENDLLECGIPLSVPDECVAEEQHYNIQSLISSEPGEESGMGCSPRRSEISAQLTTMLSIDKGHSDPFTGENDSLQSEIAISVPKEGVTEDQHYNIQSLISSEPGEESGMGCSPRHRASSAEPENVPFQQLHPENVPLQRDIFPLQQEQSLQVPNAGNMTKQFSISRSLNIPGIKEGSETAPQPRLRSNSLEGPVKQSAEERVTESGEPFEPSKLFHDRLERKQRRQLMKTRSEGVPFMRTSCSNEFPRTSPGSVNEKKPVKLERLSELSQMSTKDLPEIRDSSTKKYTPRRRPRTKSASEGVALMRNASVPALKVSADDISLANTGVELKAVLNGGSSNPRGLPVGCLELRNDRKQRRRLMKTRSEGVASMGLSLRSEFTRQSLDSVQEDKEPEKLATLSELTQISTKDLPEVPDLSLKIDKPKRRLRLKSASEGVAFMRASTVASIKGSNGKADYSSKGQKDDFAKHDLSEAMPSLETTEPAKSRVTFSLGKNPHTPATYQRPMKEHESFDSVASDDGDSDIDDVPEALVPDEMTVGSQSRMRAITQKIDLAAFFQGSQYHTVSLLFGPMACFFCVAMRVEIFNIYAGVFVDQAGVWYKFLTHFFWIEVVLYCIMIIEMLVVLIAFLSKRGTEGGLSSCTAAVFGLLINIMCLLLLYIAETKRCCPGKDANILSRLLRPDSSPKGYNDSSTFYSECCPQFGERKYGGLGIIEPFTCLIALSPLRFLVGGCVVKLFGSGSSHDEDLHTNKGADGQHQGPDPTAKVRDLWLTAIGAHSDIAKSFGLFSSELLQCMLGIYSNGVDDNNKLEASVEDCESSDANNTSIRHEGSQQHERENSIEFRFDTSIGESASPSQSTTHKRYESDSFGVTFDDFSYPMARLIRRMRRCERLIPPLLDQWMAVDVVLTCHELVLFDVLDETEGHGVASDTQITVHNGGKGMQLCDVAKGRKILSQFNLDDIDFLDIEHRAAKPGDIDAEDIEMNYKHNLLEYWQGGNCSSEVHEMDVMNKRWENVDEDRLKIHFRYETLFLRFMVDLKEMEQKTGPSLADPNLMSHIGTQTKVWCRTIARLRGSMNLKQKLPHFGNDGSDEMEDFIEMCERDEESNHNTGIIRKKIHKRMNSFVR